MRWFISYLLLLTISAYAIGLPVRLHEAEHQRAAQICSTCDSAPLSRLAHQVPADPCSLPPKKSCATCAKLQALVAATEAPIQLLDSGVLAHHAVVRERAQQNEGYHRTTSCRGPPAIT